jgi:hypothetical protein
VLQDRTVQTSGEWRQAMAEVDAGVFDLLRTGIKVGVAVGGRTAQARLAGT